LQEFAIYIAKGQVQKSYGFTQQQIASYCIGSSVVV